MRVPSLIAISCPITQSYGGYMASKVIEANSGIFKVGMAIAPVTDWRFYDSIYTERYMLSPKTNEEGYKTSAVHDMAGFANSSYLLVHGTGDDNGVCVLFIFPLVLILLSHFPII